MNKKYLYGFLTLIIGFMLVFGFAGCDLEEDDDDGPGSGDDFEYGKEFISKNLGDTYQIVYEFTYYNNNDSYKQDWEVRKNAEGYYLMLEDNSSVLEYVFIKKGEDVYWWYNYNKNKEVYEVVGGASPLELTKNEVEVYQDAVLAWGYYYSGYSSSLTKSGTETVAGRNCDKYTYSGSGYGTSVKEVYSIDKQTGMCMRFAIDVTGGGDKAGFEYVCTTFKLSGVTLPDVE